MRTLVRTSDLPSNLLAAFREVEEHFFGRRAILRLPGARTSMSTARASIPDRCHCTDGLRAQEPWLLAEVDGSTLKLFVVEATSLETAAPSLSTWHGSCWAVSMRPCSSRASRMGIMEEVNVVVMVVMVVNRKGQTEAENRVSESAK